MKRRARGFVGRLAALALVAAAAQGLLGCIDFDRELANCKDAGLCLASRTGVTDSGCVGLGANCGATDAGCVALGATCGVGNWCRVRAVPGTSLSAVAGTSAQDVWAAGGAGLVLHWNGCRWTQDTVSGSPELRGLFVVDAGAGLGDDVWVVGYIGDGGSADQPVARRWHAQAWENHDPPLGSDTQLLSIAGADPSDVWFGGTYNLSVQDSPRLEFWNGTSTGAQSPGTAAGIFGLWAFGSQNAWAVTDAYEVAHFDGSQWTKATLPAATNSSLFAIWGDSPSDVYAAGDPAPSGIIAWDGGAWASLPVGLVGYARPTAFLSIGGSGPQDVYFLGTQGMVLHKGAAGFSQAQVGSADLRGVWESSPTDVWLVGADGTVYHNGQ